MRRYFKEQCVALLASLEKADQQTLDLIRQGQHEVAIRMLADCQQSAIQLGTTIDTLEGEGSKPVHTLEEYCEAVYQLRERLIAGESVALQQAEADLHQLTDRTKREIREDLRTQFEAVFCPYKAAMWDSLESIYRAAAADPDCEAVCIPIPYYDMEDDGSRRAGHYEGDQFPVDIPIVRFDTYELEKRHPEMIFIHNPYDQYNKVTTVHPRFFSENLKKYTDCLVYVPYYATAGAMAASQAMLPAYDHADYIITQSPEINDFFDPRVKGKLVPLGSPKFDKVIHTCAEPPAPPEAWRGQLEGRRVFFYNVSLQDFLADTGAALQKMEYVFRTFRSQQDACLLWRPHPLLESTIDTMRPAAREPYEALKQMFISERIGIYDDTADIEASIALSDAYIGDSA
ncbi:MAG: hypothetical protein IJT34_10335, partial [Butyrivibrio sp.]|nr:hypothetical protein [Butyrivibrio sp.]